MNFISIGHPKQKMSQKTISDYFGITTKKEIKPTQLFIDEIPLEKRLEIANNKILYLPELIKILHKKCKTHGGCTPKIINDFYYIFKDNEILFLISFFKRNIPNQEEYFKRLGEEFQLIKENNFTKVFLQCIEILNLVGNIQFIIRGSAGSSLTTYLLGITNIDPIKENISLARFMSYTRKDMPDIDIDLPHNKRELIYHKIFKQWEGKVARISNHVIFKKKTSLKEAIRQTGYHKFIPKDFKLEDIFPKEDEQNEIYENAARLEGTFSHYSLHCGGIVIFDDIVPQKYYLKEFNIFKKGPITGTQIKLNKDEVEDENLIKIDILSNRGLSQIYELCPNKPLCDYPTDNRVWELFSNGDTLGITYAETPAMKKVYMALKPKKLGDLALGLALIRPAASGRGQKASFLTHWNGKEFVGEEECPFPTNERPWLIYDDDAIQWISRWIHCSEAVADKYRKAFAKGKRKIQLEFAAKLRKLQPQWNDKQHHWVINQLNQLQEYSFCKSHAYSYAQLVYALGYWKVNEPKRFWWATLRHSHSSYRLWVHVRAAIEVGLKGGGGRGPWELSEDGITLIPKEMIQKKLIQEDDWTDFNRHGVWWGEQFLSGLYERWEEKIVYFKGLVATGRVYVPERNIKNVETHVDGFSQEGDTYQKSRYITFLTIGTGKGLLRDLVLWGCYRVAGIRIVEGYGDWIDGDTPWIQVRKVKVCHH